MPQRHATVADLPAEFDNVESRTLLEALDRTRPKIGLTHWGDSASLGHALLAAHVLKKTGFGSNSAAGDRPSMVKVGPVSMTRPTSMIAALAHIETTEYGREYESLRKGLGPVVMAI